MLPLVIYPAKAIQIGMPMIILNGKVMPMANVNDMAGLACGRANRIAAGAAIYDALAQHTINNAAFPVSICSK